MSFSVSPYLRSKIHGLKVTAVETQFELAFSGALVIGPRVAWAADLSELDRVEVYNLVRCETSHLHVLFGAEGKVEVWIWGAQRTQSGDTLRVTAHAWLEKEQIASHTATFALIGRNNAPIEIRRIKARRVPSDPSFFPPPAREEKVILTHRPVPVEAVD